MKFNQILVLLLLGSLAACGDSSKTGEDPNNPSQEVGTLDNPLSVSSVGTVTLKLKDAPVSLDLLEKAEVTIDKIELRKENADEVESVPVPLFSFSTTFDLLKLQNGLSETLSQLTIPAGVYAQIRVYVETASVTLKDGRVFDLKIPSGSESGIKIFPSPAIEVKEGQHYELYCC